MDQSTPSGTPTLEHVVATGTVQDVSGIPYVVHQQQAGNRHERRLPVKVDRVDLSGDFEGWSAQMRVNPPLVILDWFNSGEIDQIKKGIEAIAISWDFVDEDGKPMRQPREGGVMDLTTDLMQALVQGYSAKMQSNAELPPKSP